MSKEEIVESGGSSGLSGVTRSEDLRSGTGMSRLVCMIHAHTSTGFPAEKRGKPMGGKSRKNSFTK